MNNTQQLNLISIPLHGRNLIEASAGTGKTYTIAALYTRLIVETNYQVNQILVMTFTKAATEELRTRLRNGLVDALRVFEHPQQPVDTPFLQQLSEQYAHDATEQLSIQKKLQIAIRSFDQAAILTIHGFCQRLLTESALESAIAFDNEIITSDQRLKQQVIDDIWRRRFHAASDAELQMLSTHNITVDSMLNTVSDWLAKPYLKKLLPESPLCAELLKEQLDSALQIARKTWDASATEIQTLLATDPALNHRSYSKKSVVKWCGEIQLMLEHASIDLSAESKATERFTADSVAEKTKQGCTAPSHAFFQQWQTLVELSQQQAICQQQAVNQLYLEFYEQCKTDLLQLKRRLGILSYDDLLLSLHDAIMAEASGKQLTASIAQRYPVALIDEFQDTDPIQYEIFDRIYSQAPSTLYLVGDPKQAIYSFRGADIYTYLQARNSIDEPSWTLSDNWRSSSSMVAAVNQLFEQQLHPFWVEQIKFQAVNAAQGEVLEQKLPADFPAFRCWTLQSEDSKPLGKEKARPLIYNAVADDISQLLNRAATGTFQLGDRDLTGGDIAILVRTHSQAEQIRQALAERNVASVSLSKSSVFNSQEAQQLRYILAAVIQPGNTRLIRSALSTEILGINAAQLLAFDAGGADVQRDWDAWLERFRNWHQIWQKQGFIVMWRLLLSECGCYQRLLVLGDGERRLTNLLHLAELLNQHSSEHGLTMQGLYRWLLRQSNVADEEAELRLESDENLVKIVTIHASKGLEYGLIYCPVLWDEKLNAITKDRQQAFIFHDPQNEYAASLELGSERREQARHQLAQEEMAENLRLLYVALTRAKYHCSIVTGHINGMENSALSWLLYGEGQTDSVLKSVEAIKQLGAAGLQDKLAQFVANNTDLIDCQPLPQNQYQQATELTTQAAPKATRLFRAALQDPRQVSSFTRLISGMHYERPDHDELIDTNEALLVDSTSSSATPAEPAFPRGANAGSCLHKILEQLDFTLPVPEQHGIIQKALHAYQFDASWEQHVSNWLQEVVFTPLYTNSEQTHQPMRLADLSHSDRLDEFEFYLAADCNLAALKVLLLKHYSEPAMQTAIKQLSTELIQGWLRGFIDLVFRYADHYYLADYKSNWIAAEPNAYTQKNLAQVMASEHYYLQYLIYSLALHRYLSVRIEQYSYAQHFGGVYYLFLRGMRSNAEPGSGIYFQRPTEQLIKALNQLFTAADPTGIAA